MSVFTKSHVCGARDVPLIEETIGVAFDRAVQRWPDRDALVDCHEGIRWSWTELGRRVDSFAAGLMSLGLEPGDRVGIWSPNCPEWVITQFATAKAGLILVNVNPAYRISELEFALKKVGCKALITASAFKTSNYVGMLRELAPELDEADPGCLRATRLPDLESLIRIGGEAASGMYGFNAILGRGQCAGHEGLQKLQQRLQVDDPINIQFTSGTTGTPKGATLTHRNILNNGYFVGAAQGLGETDRICIPVPLYHCFGMVMGNLAAVTHGATMVFPSPGFDPLSTLRAVEAEKCTSLYGVPTMFIGVLEHAEFDKFNLSSLRTGIMAGAPCPIEVMKRVVDTMNMGEVTIAYGMTETSPVSTQTALDDTLERRVSTVGRVQPHIEVKIVDENDEVVATGIAGEFCTRGYSVMRGYWGDEERTADVLDADGWMHSGDLATMDENGYFNIVGRIKDMVIRGGENLYPREIEEFLYGHHKIADVQVFGVPDARYGEELCAWIRLVDGESAEPEEIRAFCRGRISHLKIPRYIRFVETFPMTVTGKIQKFAMRAQMIDELELDETRTA